MNSENSEVLIPVAILALLIIGAVCVWAYVPRRQRLRRFEGRPELSPEQIYSEFFASKNLPQKLTCELWNEVAASLHVPPGKLRPTDHFAQSLAHPTGWAFDYVILK